MIDIVAEVGNSRVKLCRCENDKLSPLVRAFGVQDDRFWKDSLLEFTQTPSHWVISGSNPAAVEHLLAKVLETGSRAILINSHRQIPILNQTDVPEKVGLDRLLNTVAARSLVPLGTPAIVADIGTAVTVDLLDGVGCFAGGVIFPGLRLMARSLHQYTAKLPLIDPNESDFGELPGKNTTSAMGLGMIHALTGGIDAVIHGLAAKCSTAPQIFLTGGDATPKISQLLETRRQFATKTVSNLTLQGLLIAGIDHLDEEEGAEG